MGRTKHNTESTDSRVHNGLPVVSDLEHNQKDLVGSKESTPSTMTDRFDLEQQILECWKVTDDIRTVMEHGSQECRDMDLNALARLTDIRFEKLWFIFEQMCATRQFTSKSNG